MSNKNLIETQSKTNIVNTLHTLAEAIEKDAISNYEIQQTKETIIIKVDSLDGQERIIQEHTKIDGFSHHSTTRIRKPKPDERLKIVKTLVKQGLTQTDIAKKTMYSQKTISNDIKKLKENNEL